MTAQSSMPAIPLPLFEEERELLTPGARPDMVAWAQAHYVLPAGDVAVAGPWSPEYVPFWIEPMRWLSSGLVRQLNVAACTQAGKTETSNIFLSYRCDVEPSPKLLVLPTEDAVKERLEMRLKPIIGASPRLLKMFGDDLRNFNITKANRFGRAILYIGWANSPISLSDRPVCDVVLDEIAKYPTAVGKEADPVSLAKKRQRTFQHKSKLLIVSSPILDDDPFWRAWQSGDPYDWWASCPHCRQCHPMQWDYVELDKGPDRKLLDAREYARGGHARYRCPLCHKPWTEYERWQAVSAGQWVQAGARLRPDGTVDGARPAGPNRSIRICAWMLHPIFQGIDGLAAEWAAAQAAKRQGNVKPLQDFRNNQEAQPWKETAKETATDRLRSHIDPKVRPGIVPQGGLFLTRGIDVQLDHVYVIDVAWGDLSEAWVINAARIDCGDTERLSNYGPVEEYLKSGWPLASDPKLRRHPALTSIDCAYRTEEVTAFCRQCQRQGIKIVPARGSEATSTAMGITRPFRDANKQILRYDMNVGYFKNILYSMLYTATEPGPGYLHLAADTTEELLQHLSSEEAREIPYKGRRLTIWVKKMGQPNHWWDALVHARHAAELVGVRWLDPSAARASKPIGKPVQMKPIRTKY